MDYIDLFLIKKRYALKRKWKGVHMDQIYSLLNKKVITIEEKAEGSPQGPNWFIS